MTPSSLLAPFEQRHLQVATAAGAAATGVLVGLRRRWPRLRPVAAGPILVLSAAAELLHTGDAPRSLLLAVAVLAVGGGAGQLLLGRRLRTAWPRWLVAGAAVVPGSALLAYGPGMDVPGPSWVRVTLVVATPAATAAFWSFERRWVRLALPLLSVSAAGIYATTPDTEQILIVLGAVLGVTVAGWWAGLGVGTVAAPAVTGLVTWTVAVDGRGRHSAIVGGLGCLGLLVAEPLAASLRRQNRAHPRPGPLRAVVGGVAIQVAVVLVASRVAGLRPATGEAVVIVVVLLVGVGFVLLATPSRM